LACFGAGENDRRKVSGNDDERQGSTGDGEAHDQLLPSDDDLLFGVVEGDSLAGFWMAATFHAKRDRVAVAASMLALVALRLRTHSSQLRTFATVMSSAPVSAAVLQQW